MWKFLDPRHELPRENQARIWNYAVNNLPRVWGKETLSNREGATIEKKRLRRLQSRSKQTEATVWVGKEGVTEGLLSQISDQLKARELVKIKLQKSALGEDKTSQTADKVAASTGATLVEVMGHTFSLYKKRIKGH